MIEINDIEVQIKGFSLKNISLTIQTGSCHCLVGPTGCGKTTLLEAVLGLRSIKKGKILLDKKDITTLPVHERGFSYVPQDLAIFPHLTVEENILYGIKHSNLSDKQKRYKSGLEIAESLGINHLLKRKAVNLSGGERQRIALARALAPGHKYLLLDEPLSALHEGMKKELWLLIKELQRKYDLTILMISHDMEETCFLSDSISVMIDGTIHQSDLREKVFNMPATQSVAEFFGIKNIFKAEIIKTNGDFVTLYCPKLSSKLVLPSSRLIDVNFDEKVSVKVGIRPENIMVLRKDKESREKDNILHGRIENVFEKGTYHLIIFRPHNTQSTIEIEIPDYAYKKCGVKKGHDAEVALKKECIFYLK